jgi:hypothetical protein
MVLHVLISCVCYEHSTVRQDLHTCMEIEAQEFKVDRTSSVPHFTTFFQKHTTNTRPKNKKVQK